MNIDQSEQNGHDPGPIGWFDKLSCWLESRHFNDVMNLIFYKEFKENDHLY